MYEPSPPPAPAPASSPSSSSASSSSGGYLSKQDLAALCAEMTLALAEVNPSPPRLLALLGADGGSSGGKGKAPPQQQHVDVAASPFKELAGVMVDVALAKALDDDKRLSMIMSDVRCLVDPPTNMSPPLALQTAPTVRRGPGRAPLLRRVPAVRATRESPIPSLAIRITYLTYHMRLVEYQIPRVCADRRTAASRRCCRACWPPLTPASCGQPLRAASGWCRCTID